LSIKGYLWPRFVKSMFESTDFKSLFAQFGNQKILIIGDVMIDTYLWGSVGRVSPEAPVPIVSGVIEENRLGGAANVALNIKAMGAVPILCSVIGDDDRGKLILELMEEQLLSDVGLVVDDHRVTTQKTRIISGNQHLLRVDEEMDIFLNKRVQEEFIELISSLLESGGIDAIIMQDYDKGVLTPRVISEVISASERVAQAVSCVPFESSICSTGILGQPPPSEARCASRPSRIRVIDRCVMKTCR